MLDALPLELLMGFCVVAVDQPSAGLTACGVSVCELNLNLKPANQIYATASLRINFAGERLRVRVN
jgi:hypothetical protein